MRLSVMLDNIFTLSNCKQKKVELHTGNIFKVHDLKNVCRENRYFENSHFKQIKQLFENCFSEIENKNNVSKMKTIFCDNFVSNPSNCYELNEILMRFKMFFFYECRMNKCSANFIRNP